MDLAAMTSALQTAWGVSSVEYGPWTGADVPGVEQSKVVAFAGDDDTGVPQAFAATVFCADRGGAGERAYSSELRPKLRLGSFRADALAWLDSKFDEGTYIHANVEEWGETPSCIVSAIKASDQSTVRAVLRYDSNDQLVLPPTVLP